MPDTGLEILIYRGLEILRRQYPHETKPFAEIRWESKRQDVPLKSFWNKPSDKELLAAVSLIVNFS